MNGITVERARAGSGSLLHVRNLTVRTGLRRVLEGCSLAVQQGDILVITGGNGTGKTTLLDAIAGTGQGVIEEGTIEFMGQDITRWPANERARLGLRYLPQRHNVFPSLTVRENLCLAVGPEGPGRLHETFPDWAATMPQDRRAGLLSAGQKQRLAWAMATLRPGSLLLADEPEAGLSGPVTFPFIPTLLLVTHHPERWLPVLSAAVRAPSVLNGSTRESRHPSDITPAREER